MSLTRLKQLFSSGMRRAAMLPLQMLPPPVRARALEDLGSGMIEHVRVRDSLITFDVSTPLLQQRAHTVLSKEPDTIAWIDGFTDEAVFWDVGANVGVFSLYAALRPGLRVLAFEPSAANYQVLCRNIQLNRRHPNLDAYCLALSGVTRLGVLNLSSAATGGAVNEFGDAGHASRYSETPSDVIQQGMIGFTIDEFVQRFMPPFPHHLKIDVDGLELPILQGAERTLADPRLRSVLVELNLNDNAEHDAAVRLLSDVGLRLASTGRTQSASGLEGANHIFVRA